MYQIIIALAVKLFLLDFVSKP